MRIRALFLSPPGHIPLHCSSLNFVLTVPLRLFCVSRALIGAMEVGGIPWGGFLWRALCREGLRWGAWDEGEEVGLGAQRGQSSSQSRSCGQNSCQQRGGGGPCGTHSSRTPCRSVWLRGPQGARDLRKKFVALQLLLCCERHGRGWGRWPAPVLQIHLQLLP